MTNETNCGNECTMGEDWDSMSYEEQGHALRRDIKAVATQVKRYIGESKSALIPAGVERGEMIANATLSYRCMEDAAMRIGKSMQAFQGGISILDKMRASESAENTPECEVPELQGDH